LALGVTATVAAAIAGNGSIAAAMAPALATALLGALWVAPLRKSLFVLIFLGLALDQPGDASGLWQSPVAPLGQLLLANLNHTVPVDALHMSLMADLLGYLLLIRIHRSLSGSRIDETGRAKPASLLLWTLAISLLTLLALSVYGLARGGDIKMVKQQAQTFGQLLLMAYLLAVSLRGTLDYRTLGRVVLAAACTKALIAVWVWLTVVSELPFATTHGDSMLFACALAILLGLLFEQPVGRNAGLCVLVLPLLLAGMVANSRRLVWVEVSTVVFALYAISPWTHVKRQCTRAVLLVLPLILAYGGVGWNSNSRLFAPVRLVRSIGDADLDASTRYREIENYNLIYTLRANPWLGTGFGHPFTEAVKGDDISFFKEYRFLPHNSVLGLWGFGGMLGFTGLWATVVVGILLAARSYFRAQSPEGRVAAFAAIASVLIYVIHCWGDIGFAEKNSIFLVGSALAVAGRLAQPTSVWTARPATQRV